VMVTPPFVIDQADIGFIVQNLRIALDEVHSNLS
jgi:adenosylmethionine-8-amino-7-oxononanoate aminotransferase